MIPPAAAHILLCSIVAVSILLMLVRPRGIAEVYWIGSGVLLLLVLGLIPLSLAAHAVARGSDVYLFLTGMMLLSELAREHGVFDWVSSLAVGHARGSSSRLFLLVYAVGVAVTVSMSNDATAVVLTPAILAATRKARVAPMPYLFVCALVANAASFVLPISNPANLVVYHTQMPPLAQWLKAFAVPSLLSIAATFAVLRLLFRNDLRSTISADPQIAPLPREGKFVLGGLAMMFAVLLTASALNWDLGLPTCLAALGIAALVWIESRCSPLGLFKGISWSTLVLVAGLFVMVDAVESVGALRLAVNCLQWARSLAPAPGVLGTAFTIAVANNLVNNLPLGLIAGGAIQAAHVRGLLAHSVLLGIDLGPNLSITGSLATILWLLALRKEKLDVGFWKFFSVGVVAMPAALLLAAAGMLLMHALGGAP